MIEKDSWLNDSLRIEVHNLVHLFNCLYRKAYARLLNLKNFGSYDSRAFKEMFIDCSLLLLFFFFLFLFVLGLRLFGSQIWVALDISKVSCLLHYFLRDLQVLSLKEISGRKRT